MDIEVIYEDKYLIVFNKPEGVVVNKSETQRNSLTLQDFINGKKLIGLDDNIVSRSAEYDKFAEFIDRSGIVHRLDAATSGLIVIAKDANTFVLLQKEFETKKVIKKYLALSYGAIKDAKVGDVISVDAPIGRNPRNRQKFAIVKGAKDAQTNFKVLKIFDGFMLFECMPLTGRTHQIRVHLAALNRPVIGDILYSGKNRIKKNKELFPRMFLHAYYLSFVHPMTGLKIELISELPENLKNIIERM